MKEILKWLGHRNNILKVVFVGLALFLIIDDLITPNINGPDDLFEIESELAYFSFIKEEGYRGPFYHYYFMLNGYKCTFQVKADFVDYFKKNEFERELKIGDKIIITVPKHLINELDNQAEVIFAMSINTDKKDYLTQNLTIANESMHFPIFLGFGILLVVTFNHFIQWDRIKNE